MASEVMRDYRMLDAELYSFASDLCQRLTRDIADLGFGITNASITALQNLTDAFEAIPSDDGLLGDLMLATQTKNDLADQIRENIRNLALHIQLKWGTNSPQYRSLGDLSVSKFSDDVLHSAADNIHKRMTGYLPDLLSTGLTQNYLDDYSDLITSYQTARNAVTDKIEDRDNTKQLRIRKGNELYGFVVNYCEIGKRVFEKTDPARYNDYLIYTGSTPGTLDKPTGISFNIANMKVSWNALENATSYIASISTDGGASYQEVYSGSDTFFVYEPTYFGEVSVLIKGHNSGGNGIASDPYTFTFFDVLPAPEGLTISLVSETTGLIRLNFEEVASATTYKIFRSVVGLGMPAGEYTYITEQSGNEYVGNTTAGMRNYFYVKAGNAVQLSAASTAVFMDMAVIPE